MGQDEACNVPFLGAGIIRVRMKLGVADGWMNEWVTGSKRGDRVGTGGMIIEESVEIRAPLGVVWEVFSRLENWEEWNSVCRGCSLPGGGSMQAGACFAFTLRPYFVPIKISPRITRCEPAREVVWEGGRLGIHAQHRFTFLESGDTVHLISREVFVGPLLWLCRLLFIPRKLHGLSRKMLQEIRAESERCAVRAEDSREGGDP